MVDRRVNTVCECGWKCCFLQGCCWKCPGRSLEDPPLFSSYCPVKLPTVFAGRMQPGVSLLDLPPELLHQIFKLVLLTRRILNMSLDPTIRHSNPTDTWGAGNRFALLATCRQFYHDGSVLAYGENLFLIERGLHRDFSIPRAPGMPWHKIHYLMLQYPQFSGKFAWSLPHAWEHWLQDSSMLTSRFPNLRYLIFKVSYNENNSVYGGDRDRESWQSVFYCGNMEPREFAEKVRKVVVALADINGRRMPGCVRLDIDYSHFRFLPGYNLNAINRAIPLAWNRSLPWEESTKSYPIWRDGWN